MNKIVFSSIILILLFSLVLLNGCACKTDDDCKINSCCNPSSCILKNKAPQCSSIVVCPTEPAQVTCGCSNGKCVVK